MAHNKNSPLTILTSDVRTTGRIFYCQQFSKFHPVKIFHWEFPHQTSETFLLPIKMRPHTCFPSLPQGFYSRFVLWRKLPNSVPFPLMPSTGILYRRDFTLLKIKTILNSCTFNLHFPGESCATETLLNTILLIILKQLDISSIESKDH